LNVEVEKSVALGADGTAHRMRTNMMLANLLGEQAVFLIRQR